LVSDGNLDKGIAFAAQPLCRATNVGRKTTGGLNSFAPTVATASRKLPIEAPCWTLTARSTARTEIEIEENCRREEILLPDKLRTNAVTSPSAEAGLTSRLSRFIYAPYHGRFLSF